MVAHVSNFPGAVENPLSDAKLRMQQRGEAGVPCCDLTVEDFGAEREGPDDGVLDTLLDDIVGCQSVKTRLEELRDLVLFAQVVGLDA